MSAGKTNAEAIAADFERRLQELRSKAPRPKRQVIPPGRRAPAPKPAPPTISEPPAPDPRNEASPYCAGHRAFHAGLPADPPPTLLREHYVAWRQGWTDARLWALRQGGRAHVQTR